MPKDACYKKVKARYRVFPSAYASGAIAKCRKVGAANYGKSTKKKATGGVVKMEKGGEAKKTGSMASRKKGREYTKLDYEKDKFKEVAKRVGKVAKTPYNLVTKGMSGALKEFNKLIDTPVPKYPKVGSRKKNVIKMKNGGYIAKGCGQVENSRRKKTRNF